MFRGKTILVTGGIEGIGEAVVTEIIAEGGNVVIFDNQSISLNVKFASNPKIKFYRIDLSDSKSLEELCNSLLNERINIDGIVNNVGLFNGNGLDSSIAEWEESLRVNILSAFIISRTFSKCKVLKSIVNVASISGMIAQKNYLIYNTMKSAVINMTRCIALELGSRNIRCNSVSPGTVWTNKNKYYISLSHGIDRAQADFHPEFGGGTILKRVANPSEIAKPIVFLLSCNSSYITGENLVIDGGRMSI